MNSMQMKTISLQQLKTLSSLGEIGADSVCVIDEGGEKWTLIKQSTHDKYSEKIADSEKALIRRIALFAVQEQTISASALQRKFSLGYAHACRILEYMEEAGYISSANGIEPRKVFADKQQILSDFQ